jgi:protoporphyrinogen oxidase
VNHGFTRRDLLAGSLAATLAGTVGCGGPRARNIRGGFADTDSGLGHRLRDGGLPPATGAPRRTPIAIVGAGVAGLAAAWRLRRAGLEDLVLFELGPAPGGTARGGSLGGLACPWGAHYLPLPSANQRALVAFLEMAGVVHRDPTGRVTTAAENLVRAPQERVCGLGFWEEGLWLHAGASPEDHEQLARFEGLMRDQQVLDGHGRRLFDLPLEHSSKTRRDLDKLDGATWAAQHGLTGERVRAYLEYATRDDFGCSLEQTSAWALLHYFNARANLVSGESPEFLTWPEGNAHLVKLLAAGLDERLRTGKVVTALEPRSVDIGLEVFDVGSGRSEAWSANQVVLATPQFLTRRLLAATTDPAAQARARFRYAPWVVANLHLDHAPISRGFPLAWDNVIQGSPSLGYVSATHQLDRADERDDVWTWYLPLTGANEAELRTDLLNATWEHWRDLILADLRMAHPDLAESVTCLDVWRWGHGMVKPVPGLIWGGERALAAAPLAGGRITLAHTDLSGMALFEEAHWQGVRAAEQLLTERGLEFESLL